MSVTGRVRIRSDGTEKEAKMSMGKVRTWVMIYKIKGVIFRYFISQHLALQIIFYEGRNFTGRSWESSGDCSNMSTYLNCCYSCRVESGCWMVYDRPNFMGNQYFLRKGEYNDYINTWGMNGWIRSCRWIPMVSLTLLTVPVLFLLHHSSSHFLFLLTLQQIQIPSPTCFFLSRR